MTKKYYIALDDYERGTIINCLNEMLDFWNELAIKNGFDGMKFAYQNIGLDLLKD